MSTETLPVISLSDLAQSVEAYCHDQIGADQFVDSFRTVSRSKFAAPPNVLDACLEIEAAISELDYDGMSEADFKLELAKAVSEAQTNN